MSTAAAAAAMLDQQQQHQRRCLPLSSSSSPPPRTTSTPLPPPLPETALLRGALCALQGADSDVLRFCKERDAFVLTCEAALATPRAAASLVLQLAEVGWLHRRVRRAAGTCCTNGENSSSSSSSSGCSDGAVARAFRAALRGELAASEGALRALEEGLARDVSGYEAVQGAPFLYRGRRLELGGAGATEASEEGERGGGEYRSAPAAIGFW